MTVLRRFSTDEGTIELCWNGTSIEVIAPGEMFTDRESGDGLVCFMIQPDDLAKILDDTYGVAREVIE